MKKITTILYFVAIAILVATTTSCEKIENVDSHSINSDGCFVYTVTVNLPSGSKALGEYGNILSKTFAAGDQIKLTYGSNTVISELLDGSKLSNGNQSATFEFRFNSEPNLSVETPITYEYPAAHTGLSGQDGTFDKLQSHFDYAKWEGSVINAGELPTPTTPLANQYAIGKFTIKNSSGTDISNTLTQLTISDGTNTYTIAPQYGPIWVAMNPVNDKAITFTATDGTNSYYKTTGSSQTLLAGKLYIINVTMIKVEGALPGRFTINADGGQVYFSRGNLQATNATANSTDGWAWSFAEHQYDYIGGTSIATDAGASANNKVGNNFITTAGTVDLYVWIGKTSSLSPYGINNSTAKVNYSTSTTDVLKYDWGTLPITNGGNTANSGWRTPSCAEWTYILNGRANAADKVGFATVGGKSGIIILPDIFTDPMKNGGSGAFVPKTMTGFEANVYTTGGNWEAMEANGAVFLPYAGSRAGTSVSNYGGYWSSTCADPKDGNPHAYYLHFTASMVDPTGSFTQHYGFSVRLVRDVI